MCKIARLSRIIDQLIARGTSFSLCPNWFKDMHATIILELVISLKPFEGSPKSNDPFDGRIELLNGGPGRGRKAVKEFHFSSVTWVIQASWFGTSLALFCISSVWATQGE